MTKRLHWLNTGYALVAEKGFEALQVEVLALHVASSKSSFYHYFGNVDEYRRELFALHLDRSGTLAQNIGATQNLFPGLVDAFIEHKADILFHKQVRIHREEPAFRSCFEKAYAQVEPAILEKWSEHLALQDRPLFAKSLLQLVSDNFLLRITPQNFKLEWLADYVQEISYLVLQMKSKTE